MARLCSFIEQFFRERRVPASTRGDREGERERRPRRAGFRRGALAAAAVVRDAKRPEQFQPRREVRDVERRRRRRLERVGDVGGGGVGGRRREERVRAREL